MEVTRITTTVSLSQWRAAFILGLALFTSCGLNFDKNGKIESDAVKIGWEDSLTGDFSFTEDWDYPEGIYKNEFGQLSCDGLCPPEIDRMKDVNGKIYEDSLQAFYGLVDTTHQYHSLQSDASAYEWAGANFATAQRVHADTVVCFTHTDMATHSSLILTIVEDTCIPVVEMNSVAGHAGKKLYSCNAGLIRLDRRLFEEGILKAVFDFTFDHPEAPGKPMYWKGKVYTAIKPN